MLFRVNGECQMRYKKIIILFAAVLSGAMAFMLVIGASNNTQAQLPTPVEANTVDVLVAAQHIEVGQTIADTTLEWRSWPEDFVADDFIVRDEMPDAISEFSGGVALTELATDEPVIESLLFGSRSGGYMASMLEDGQRAMSIAIEPETTANGFILPGNHVDVLVSRALATTGDDNYYAQTVLRDVLVLAIDETVAEEDGALTIPGTVATLAVRTNQAETLAAAVRLGTISLVLRGNDEQADYLNRPDCRDNRSIKRIRVIRYSEESYQIVNTGSCGELRRNLGG
ncbi:MAG: pilus assembly protein CpaB [Gammaproteobacteria bacterium]|jgi:pilus assembly protein CpaB